MMGPSKACVADTPRLARHRTPVSVAFERARSPQIGKACPMHHPSYPPLPINSGAFVRRVERSRVGDVHVPPLLSHAPLLN
jgi:hypothetical protein